MGPTGKTAQVLNRLVWHVAFFFFSFIAIESEEACEENIFTEGQLLETVFESWNIPDSRKVGTYGQTILKKYWKLSIQQQLYNKYWSGESRPSENGCTTETWL
jgi:hypothetical protein